MKQHFIRIPENLYTILQKEATKKHIDSTTNYIRIFIIESLVAKGYNIFTLTKQSDNKKHDNSSTELQQSIDTKQQSNQQSINNTSPLNLIPKPLDGSIVPEMMRTNPNWFQNILDMQVGIPAYSGYDSETRRKRGTVDESWRTDYSVTGGTYELTQDEADYFNAEDMCGITPDLRYLVNARRREPAKFGADGKINK